MTPDAETRDTPTGLPPYLLTSEIAALIRADRLVHQDLPEDRRRRLAAAMARRFLRRHGVPSIRVGKSLVYRREAVLDAVTTAEREGARR